MSDIYQHFRKDERAFIDQALEWKRIVQEQYRMKLTDFLDPREQVILAAVTGQADVGLAFSAAMAERSENGLFYILSTSSRKNRILSFRRSTSAMLKNL